MKYDFNILYYIAIFRKYRKKIVFLMVIAITIVLIASFLKQPTYTSRCTILLSDSASSPSLSNLTKFMGFPGFSFGNSSANTIISIVKSRRMMNDIYSNFQELKNKSYFKLEVYDTTQGTLIIEVKGREPKLSSDIADFCARNLDKIYTELDITSPRPIAKVLDEAVPAVMADSRQILKYISIAAIFAFFVGNIFFFGLEYYKALISINK